MIKSPIIIISKFFKLQNKQVKMERLGKRAKFILFFSAYSPLFLIIVVKNHSFIKESIINLKSTASFWLIIIPFVASLLAVIVLTGFIEYHKTLAADNEFEVIDCKDNSSEIISFILTYIIPFLQPNLNNRYDIFSIYILLGIIGLIYVNSNMLYINPLFYALGFNTLELDVKNTDNNEIRKIVLLIKNKEKIIKKGEKINIKLINNSYKNIYFFKSKTGTNLLT